MNSQVQAYKYSGRQFIYTRLFSTHQLLCRLFSIQQFTIRLFTL